MLLVSIQAFPAARGRDSKGCEGKMEQNEQRAKGRFSFSWKMLSVFHKKQCL